MGKAHRSGDPPALNRARALRGNGPNRQTFIMTIDCFLLAGQSNMQGGIRVNELPSECAHWPQQATLIGPSGPYEPLEQETLGPELSFAQDIASNHPEPFFIVKFAAGGTNLANEWSVDGKPRIDEDPSHRQNLLAQFFGRGRGRAATCGWGIAHYKGLLLDAGRTR